jgi:peptide/nickel transport system substrate-binding protein
MGPGPRVPAPVSRRAMLRWMGLAAGASLLAACAPAAPPAQPTAAPAAKPPAGTTAPAATSAPAAAAAGTPRKGGTLTVVTGDGLVPDLFTGSSFGPQGLSFIQFVWPLFRTKPASFEIVPALAEAYEASQDRLSHKVTLRQGITFHDGSPIDAEAVAANLRAAFNTEDPLRGPGAYQMIPLFWGGFPGNFKGITVNDPRSFTIQLNQPRADLRGALCFIFIYNPKILKEKPKDYGTDVAALKDIGSGPFRIADFKPNQYAEYTRVDGFFEEAYLERLRIQLVPDASARFVALKSGQAQVAIGLTNADYDASVKDPAYRAHVSNPGNNVFIALNASKSEPLRDRDVREAMARAMNRQAYVDSFFSKGLAQLGTQVALSPGTPGYNADVKPIPYDVEGAKKLLEKANVRNLNMSIVGPAAFASAPELKRLMEAIAADLGKVGVTLQVNVTDVAGWLAQGKDNDMIPVPYGNSGNDVAVASLYLKRPPTAYQPPSDPKYATLLDEANVATDLSAQNAKLKELMALTAENIAGIPVAYVAAAALSTSKVHDVSMTAAPLDPLHRTWTEN